MKTSVLALSLLLCLLPAGHAQLYEGDACRLDNGTPGICRTVPSCPAARDEIVKGNFPKVCSYKQYAPVVCCVESTVATRRPPTRGPTTRRPPSRRPTATPGTTAAPTEAPRIIKRVDESTISGKKCREYARYVYWERQTPVLSIIPEYENVSECVQNVETLIVGGVVAETKEFPHMAALGYGPKEDIRWLCGGSLISERYILTAAHCLSARGIGPVAWVRLGDLNINSTEDDVGVEVTMKVVERIKHQGYKPPAHYNDIALLKMETNVTFSPYIRPTCLYNKPGNPINLNNASAIGWGKIEFTEDFGSPNLMKVSLSLQSPTKCNHTYRNLIQTGTRLSTGINPESMICAGDPEGKRDTCGGDSGGPLQIRLQDPDPVCMYSLIGLTSFGVLACGKGDNPAVYTRISNYIPWIESIVWPQN